MLACLGLMAGLACWTNVKIVVVLGPILLVLLAQDPRLPLRRGGWLLAAGFLLGSLPAWIFYALQPHALRGEMCPPPGSSGGTWTFPGRGYGST